MKTALTAGEEKANLTSADTQRLENDSVPLMKEKAIDDAKDEDPEGGRASPPSCAAVTHDTEQDQGISENEDPRLITPKSTEEAEIVEEALSMTRVHYLGLTGEFAPSPLPSDSYMTQWAYIQEQLDAHWVHNGRSGDPPKLYILDPWSYAHESSEYQKEQDSENAKGDS
ncbi:hypothetical protein MMC22_004495 [Lobaria immixta]|nr:hypothetical protein [Lobaria immixta]